MRASTFTNFASRQDETDEEASREAGFRDGVRFSRPVFQQDLTFMIDALLFTFKWLAAGGLIVVGAVLAFVGLMAFPGTK